MLKVEMTQAEINGAQGTLSRAIGEALYALAVHADRGRWLKTWAPDSKYFAGQSIDTRVAIEALRLLGEHGEIEQCQQCGEVLEDDKHKCQDLSKLKRDMRDNEHPHAFMIRGTSHCPFHIHWVSVCPSCNERPPNPSDGDAQ